MQNILLFENYTNLKDNYQRISFQRNEFDIVGFPKAIVNPDFVNLTGAKELAELELLSKTIPVEDYWVEEIVIEYNIQPVFSRYGIDEIELNLKKVRIVGTYEIAKGDDDTDSYEFDITDIGPFDNRVEIGVGTLPFYPTSMEVDLSSVDQLHTDQITNTIKYSFVIGS